MFNEGKYDFINAKVHGMRSKLYYGENLSELLTARTLVELIRRIYPDKFGDIPINPTIVEKKLVESYLDDLFTIQKSLSGKEQEFIQGLVEKYQVTNLKILLKFWEKKQKGNLKVQDLLKEVNFYLMPKAGDLPIEDLLSAPDFHAFYATIPQESYSKAADKASRFFYRTQNPFFIEVALDLAYFQNLIEKINNLGNKDQEIAQKIYGTEIDWHVLSWILRLKENYKIASDLISELFGIDFYQLKKGILKNIINQESKSDLLGSFPLNYRKSFEMGIKDGEHSTDDYLWSQLYREARRIFPVNLFNLGLIICYTIFKRVELINLVRLMQGMKYGLPKARIKRSFIPLEDWED